ncbi:MULTISPECIES: polymorphic toxin type 44 domain-containing protein [unclassified Paenibacillus]|uniref:polymorphic toxin type 44 domain-containing protein n=1 Tax=unclassified Paenibacillus TaxID=185978 RepID=UPI002404D250|nr:MULTISPECIES: polymorphic toxin type 44 domain-containing protein [unclassified Paenibacillus]MDF9843839.1 hypothetical protein [Paenibacillus sp. PastF-2]MDF9850477.1 hypothetical protein [Paenibacillus sp. PastM-2]MDF9857018.1 hypothetical protein [Paenibacillus sp. PastF-1]MDH6482290.1 hypothetical protein [Paenibacillus sp. PastH-2]MDH6509743.1 hypothetical protein [Paenibacillus sp. PastM-3]
MKKIRILQLISLALIAILISTSVNSNSIAWADPTASNSYKSSTELLESLPDTSETTAIQQLHQKAVELKLLKISENVIDLNVLEASKTQLQYSNEVLFGEYVRSLQAANRLVEGGYAYYDANYTPQLVNSEEIQKISSQEKESSAQEAGTSKLTPARVEIFDLSGLVQSNRTQLSSYYWDVYYGAILSGGNAGIAALTASAFWFKGKVQAGGPWDYKSQPGWGGYSKSWYADTYRGFRYVTTEYIGNYNYGFTGSFLFSLNILYYGGQYANGNIWQPEGQGDRTAISDGYNDAANH